MHARNRRRGSRFVILRFAAALSLAAALAATPGASAQDAPAPSPGPGARPDDGAESPPSPAPEDPVARWIRLLQSVRASDRIRAEEGLLQIGPPSIAPLEKLIEEGKEPAVSQAKKLVTRVRLACGFGSLEASEKVAVLMNGYADRTEAGRLYILESLAAQVGAGASAALLEIARTDPVDSLRISAVEFVSRFDTAEVDRRLPRLYDEDSPPLRLAAVNALALRDTPESQAVLVRAARDASAAIRLSAVGILTRRPGPSSDGALLGALLDPEPQVIREAARGVIERDLGAAVPVLAEMARSPSPDDSRVGLTGLLQLTTVDASRALWTLAGETDDLDRRSLYLLALLRRRDLREAPQWVEALDSDRLVIRGMAWALLRGTAEQVGVPPGLWQRLEGVTVRDAGTGAEIPDLIRPPGEPPQRAGWTAPEKGMLEIRFTKPVPVACIVLELTQGRRVAILTRSNGTEFESPTDGDADVGAGSGELPVGGGPVRAVRVQFLDPPPEDSRVTRVDVRPGDAAGLRAYWAPWLEKLRPAIEAVRCWPPFLRGVRAAGAGQSEAACAAYSEALRIDSGFFPALLERAAVRVARSDFDAAYADALAALRVRPDSKIALRLAGSCVGYLGQPSRAERHFEKAIALDPGDYVSWRMRGFVRSELDDAAGAEEDYTQALRLRPDSAESFAGRGIARLRGRKYAEAIADFGQVLRLQPGDAAALYNIACAHALSGKPEAAVDFLRRSVAAGFDDGDWISRDPDLVSLHEDPGFKEILGRLTAPPFRDRR